MKHCPNPECPYLTRFGRIAEFRDEIISCADCNGPLAPGPAPSVPEAQPDTDRELVTIYEAPDAIRGHLLKAILIENGISAVVIGDALGGAIGELPTTVLCVRVQVPPEMALEAAELALSFDRGELAIDQHGRGFSS